MPLHPLVQVRAHPAYFRSFESILVADDDVRFDAVAINRLFQMRSELDAWVITPAFLTWHHDRFAYTAGGHTHLPGRRSRPLPYLAGGRVCLPRHASSRTLLIRQVVTPAYDATAGRSDAFKELRAEMGADHRFVNFVEV